MTADTEGLQEAAAASRNAERRTRGITRPGTKPRKEKPGPRGYRAKCHKEDTTPSSCRTSAARLEGLAEVSDERHGGRVPAALVSPYIKPGTILRLTEGSVPHNGPPYPFDHTSVIATLRKCFNLVGPLTQRDAVAPDLETVLNLETPSNSGPDKVEPLPNVDHFSSCHRLYLPVPNAVRYCFFSPPADRSEGPMGKRWPIEICVISGRAEHRFYAISVFMWARYLRLPW